MPSLEAAGSFIKDQASGYAAFAMPLRSGRFSTGAGAGWNGSENMGVVQLASCYVVTGDPVGFMEGLYGPSITTGASVSIAYNDSSGSVDAEADLGFQFSLFPSFAMGVNCADVSGDAVFHTGFSHVFNRNLEIHVNYGSETWQGGAELTVSPQLKVLAGTEGNHLNGGFVYTMESWDVSYGAVFSETSVGHALCVSRRFP